MKKAMSDGLKRATKARLIGAGLSVALMLMAGLVAPSMAEDSLEQDLGIIRACGSDVWSLCSGVLPDVGRVKACIQDKMGQLSKGCIDKLLDKMAGQSFKVCKNQTYALCAAARCNVFDGVAYCQCDVKHGDSISLPFPMGKGEDVCSVNAAGADNKYMISTYSLPEFDRFAAGRRRGLHLLGRGLWCLCSVRRRNMLQKHRGYDVPGLRQACAEGTNHLFLPYHSGQDRRRRAGLSNPRALSLRQVLLPVLQSRHRHQQDGFDDLCRCSNWHGSGSGGPAQRQGSARQRVSGVSPIRSFCIYTPPGELPGYMFSSARI